MIPKEFYIAYGNMLYAIAMSDGSVQPKEKETILKLVKDKLVPLENISDQIGTDLANYAIFAFETADDQILDGQVALDAFIDYVELNKPKFTPEQLQVMHSILIDVAKSYGRVTKTEQKVIDVFEHMLLKI